MGWVKDNVIDPFTGKSAEEAADRARESAERQGVLAIEEQRAAREQFFERSQPFVDLGLEAGDLLRSFLAEPDVGATVEEINPVLSFLRDEGFREIQETAAAQGRLGAGGTLKDLGRFNTQLASTIVPQLQQQALQQRQQRFNELFNVLGMGANVTTRAGTAGLNTAANIGNIQRGVGQAQGAAAQQAAAARGQGASNLLNLGGSLLGAAGGFPSFGGGGGGGTFTPTADVFSGVDVLGIGGNTNPSAFNLGGF